MEFRRLSGAGDPAQAWMDMQLPICPMCKSPAMWETGVDQPAGSRWSFRCAECGVVLSTPPETSGPDPSKPVAGVDTPDAREVRVESVTRSEDEDFVGEELPLSELQEWAREG